MGRSISQTEEAVARSQQLPNVAEPKFTTSIRYMPRATIGRPAPLAAHVSPDEYRLAEDILRDGAEKLGVDCLKGQPMVALFEFVRRFRIAMGQKWPALPDETACMILKSSMHLWNSDLKIRFPRTTCNAMTGWIEYADPQAIATEYYIG
jgi:hypothetical protein